MTTLTYEEVLADLTAIVEEVGPDFVYEPLWDPDAEAATCVYVQPGTGEPSCGVGQWGAKRGVNPQAVFDLGLNEDTGADFYLDQLHHEVNALPEVEDRARVLLVRFQQLQDGRGPYGDVLSQAQIDANSGEYVVVTTITGLGEAWHNTVRVDQAVVSS